MSHTSTFNRTFRWFGFTDEWKTHQKTTKIQCYFGDRSLHMRRNRDDQFLELILITAGNRGWSLGFLDSAFLMCIYDFILVLVYLFPLAHKNPDSFFLLSLKHNGNSSRVCGERMASKEVKTAQMVCALFQDSKRVSRCLGAHWAGCQPFASH